MKTKSADDLYDDATAVRRRDDVLRRMLKTPPKPHKAPAQLGTADNPVIGVLPPPGMRWQILGKWTDADTQDMLREKDRIAAQAKRSPRSTMATEKKPRPNWRTRRQGA